ncbi:MAG: signal recognition particle-docking protein FtsY [Candidatus Kapabacteria bacterium]|nr:signal recognition particle-docking protein FtsY [Candidatus Kapabacteria bacterium]
MGLFDKIKKSFSSAVTAVADTFSIDRLKEGLEKTRSSLVNRLSALLTGRKIDAALLDEVEEILLAADIGVQTTGRILDGVKEAVKREGYDNAEDIIDLIKAEISTILIESPSQSADKAFTVDAEHTPHVIMMVGVNGVGKTTTIGKLAHNYKRAGKSVIIGAADTFRAAANEQLEVWAQRAGVDIVQQRQGADPAAVAYDTLQAAIARKTDVCIIDTAGRLHNKQGLMQELEKISRVMKKLKPDAPNDVFLALDATTGQNAILQAKEFSKVSEITGLVLTKLDGTAKGGVIIAIANELKIPVRYIGVGEKIDDLQPFEIMRFVEALFEQNEQHAESSTNQPQAE